MSDRTWEELDDAARRAIRNFIAGRRLFPLIGPHGYEVEAVPTGEVAPAAEMRGVSTAVLQPRPMVELRTPFTVSRREIEVLDRGGDSGLDQVVEAARRIAAAEDHLVFDGLDAAGIKGVVAASPYDPIALGSTFTSFPDAIAKAVDLLRAAGVEGPYGIEIHSGLDFSIRYLAHDREHVELVETVTFRNIGPDAAACIR